MERRVQRREGDRDPDRTEISGNIQSCVERAASAARTAAQVRTIPASTRGQQATGRPQSVWAFWSARVVEENEWKSNQDIKIARGGASKSGL